jgi:hypothetical protein
MRTMTRCLVWVCMPLLSFGPSAYVHADTSAKPVLDGMTAMQLSLGALRPALGNGAVGAVNFDAASGVWQFRFDRGQGMTPAGLEVTLDESTGAVCAHDPALPAGTCVARGSAAAQLKQARDERTAQEEAVQHPAPDLQGVMMALIRYQAQAKDGYLRANPMPLYVSLGWPDGSRHLDLSESAIHQLADLRLKIFPASAQTASQEIVPEASRMVMSVGLPTHRQDGDYEVKYGFYCGSLCASWHTAVLHRDAKGWHVLSSRMDAIS